MASTCNDLKRPFKKTFKRLLKSCLKASGNSETDFASRVHSDDLPALCPRNNPRINKPWRNPHAAMGGRLRQPTIGAWNTSFPSLGKILKRDQESLEGSFVTIFGEFNNFLMIHCTFGCVFEVFEGEAPTEPGKRCKGGGHLGSLERS